MITLTENGLEKPQKVRQFFVPQKLEFFVTSEGIVAKEDDSFMESDSDSDQQDIPLFLKNRSLRRRLDDAFESCYQSNMAGWFAGLFKR